jgi:protein dithiol oxidoreductase (disulfide-forming)
MGAGTRLLSVSVLNFKELLMLQGSRRQFSLSALGAATAAAFGPYAPNALAQQAPSKMEDGFEFRSVKPVQKTEDPKRIELLEFFWYGCPHCNAIEPALQEWVKRLPPDVHFKKIHVNFKEPVHQQLFFTLETMGKDKELTPKVFYRIHGERDPFMQPEKMADYLAPFGLDKKAFMDTFKSFGVLTKMKRATQIQEAYKVDGVPAFAVNGKYYTAPTMAGSNSAVIGVIETLIARERQARK